MTYKEGLAIAKKYGLENEFNSDYLYNMSNYNCSEEVAVLEALSEMDLL